MANFVEPFTHRPSSARPTGEAVSPAKLIHLPDKLARVLWNLDVKSASPSNCSPAAQGERPAFKLLPILRLAAKPLVNH